MTFILDIFRILCILLFPVLILYLIFRILFKVFISLKFSFIISFTIVFLSMFFCLEPLISKIDNGVIFLFHINNWNIAIHLIGFILPLMICISLIKRKIIQIKNITFGIISISIISFFVTKVIPEKGIVSPFPLWLFPSFIAFLLSIIIFNEQDKSRQNAYSYIISVIGVFIGADILHLYELLSYNSQISMNAIIGGAGAWDLIFISGIFSVLLIELYHFILSNINFSSDNRLEYLPS